MLLSEFGRFFKNQKFVLVETTWLIGTDLRLNWHIRKRYNKSISQISVHIRNILLGSRSPASKVVERAIEAYTE